LFTSCPPRTYPIPKCFLTAAPNQATNTKNVEQFPFTRIASASVWSASNNTRAFVKSVAITEKKCLKLCRELHFFTLSCPFIVQAENPAEKLPFTAGKQSDAVSLIFVCTGTACQPPVSNISDALQLLQRSASFDYNRPSKSIICRAFTSFF
jgi:uncharacterized protein YyaL (SSP411 family)